MSFRMKHFSTQCFHLYSLPTSRKTDERKENKRCSNHCMRTQRRITKPTMKKRKQTLKRYCVFNLIFFRASFLPFAWVSSFFFYSRLLYIQTLHRNILFGEIRNYNCIWNLIIHAATHNSAARLDNLRTGSVTGLVMRETLPRPH